MIGTVAGLACALAGVAALKSAWSRHGGGWRIALGWALVTCGVIGWRLCGVAWDKAVALTILTPSLAALFILAWTAQLSRKRQRPALLPATGDTRAARGAGFPWRGLARAVLAGPIAGGAAVSLAGALALRAPAGEADRLVAAGFVAPIAWALGGLWATTDARLVQVGSVLVVVGAASFAWARL